jgi:hypothetical protein
MWTLRYELTEAVCKLNRDKVQGESSDHSCIGSFAFLFASEERAWGRTKRDFGQMEMQAWFLFYCVCIKCCIFVYKSMR